MGPLVIGILPQLTTSWASRYVAKLWEYLPIPISFAVYVTQNNFSSELLTVFKYCFTHFQRHLYGTYRFYASQAHLP